MNIWCVLTLAFMMSLFLTWLIRRLALAKNIMDVPNSRSSHQIPTPRGGGLAFVLTFSAVTFLLMVQDTWSLSQSAIFMSASLLIAALGFFDDLGYLNIRWRLFGHFLASIIAVYSLHGLPDISFLAWMIPSNMILAGCGVFYLVWLLNLYNFMDGIDGIAGVEAVSVCIGIASIYWLSGESNLIYMPLILAASVAGFLYWNTPFARIFMGDAGSGFLGFILGALSLQGAWANPRYFWSWLILLGVFMVDATLTILMRAFQGAKIYEAHRTHAYQHASRALSHHYQVTMAVFMINLVWLFPIAWCVGCGFLNGTIGLLIAYLPLVALAFIFKAGKKENNNSAK